MPGGTSHGGGEPLLGRDAELAACRAALEGEAPLLVVGEAGIGKTSLVRAALADRRRLEGGGFATLAWMPFLALERATGRRFRGDADRVAAEVERAVGPDVLFVDDTQWVNPATLDVLGRLAGRIALVVAVRRGDQGTAAVLAQPWAAEATVVEVGPLDPDDAARLAAERAPGLSQARAVAIAARSGGNPFLVEQLAATGEPTAGLRLAVADRLDGLEPAELETLALLALADVPLPEDAVPGAASLIDRGLAAPAPGSGIGVRHPLLAEAVVARLEPDVAARCHRRLADLVAGDGARARHLAAGGNREAAHALARSAAGVAVTPGERAAHLAVAAATADGPEADELRLAAAAAMRVAGDLEGATAALDALSGPDPEVLAMAEAIRARVHWSRGDPESMRAAIARGLELVGGCGTRAEAALRAESVTVTALVDGRFDEGLAAADAALSLALETGHDPTRALLLRATILAGLGRPGWAEALEAVVTAAREAGDPETELSAANNLVTGHEMHGRPEDGRAIARAMEHRAAELGLAAWERQFGALVANLDLHAGDIRAALARSQDLLELPLDPLATQQVGLTAALALVDLGHHEEATRILGRLLPAAAPDVTGRGDVLFVLAEAALWAGTPSEALAHLDAYRAFEGSEYPTSFLVDVTAAWVAVEAGRPLPTRIAEGEPAGMLVGALAEREAVEALASGDLALAATRFDDAAHAYAGFHRRAELRSRWAAAEARRRTGDEDRARDALVALEGPLERDGFRPLLARVHRSLRLLGVRRSARGPAADPASTLTAREREIASLVAAGLTNREIARRMGLGRPTVARLLSSAMDKVGVDSRTQLVARIGEPV